MILPPSRARKRYFIFLPAVLFLVAFLYLVPPAGAGKDGLGGRLDINTTAAEAGEIRMLPDREYYQALLRGIENAKKRIDMAMFLFKTTDHPKNRPARIVRALGKARERGVEVRVILERSDRDRDLDAENERVASQLRQRGITVDFDNPKITTHAKLVIIDNRWLFVGSHNLTESALSRNHEFSLLIDDPNLAARAGAYLGKIR